MALGKMPLWILFAILLSQTVWGRDFLGGTMFFKFTDISSALYQVEITSVTAWKLGEGPCGMPCTESDVGRSTKSSRNSMISLVGSETFGSWSREENYVQSDITSAVTNTLEGKVTAVNEALGFEEEVSRVVLTVDPTFDYTDVSFHGDSWRSFDYAYTGTTSYHLQVKINHGIRNDTEQPNNSPVVIAQPLYSIPLEQKSTIQLAATDSDGDKVKCSVGKFISAGGLTVPPKVTVNEDCTIDIETLASAGYFDGGVGAIPIVITDYNRQVITIEGESFHREPDSAPLSQVLLQFMFKTVADLSGPEFVFPTYESQHMFEVYQGCFFRFPLVVQFSNLNGSSSILARSAPSLELSTGSVLDLMGGTKHVEISSPRHIPVGAYAVGAIVSDSGGSTDRNYKLQVKPLNSLVKVPTIDQAKAPYMVYVPNEAYVCQLDSTCTFPVFTKVGVIISMVNSTFTSVEVGYKSTETINLETVEETDITVTSGVVGINSVCLNIQEKVTEDRVGCMDIVVEGDDICQTVHCENGGGCTPEPKSLSKFKCVCVDGYEGPTCGVKVVTSTKEPEVPLHTSTRKPKVCNCACNTSSEAVIDTRGENSTIMSPAMASGVTMGTAIAAPIGVVLGGGVLTALKKCISKVSPQEVIDEIKDKLPEIPEDEEEDEEEEARKRKKEEEDKWREEYYTSLDRPSTEYQSFDMMGLPDSGILFV